MSKKQPLTLTPGLLLLVGSLFGVLFWLTMLFYAYYLGGTSGPPGLEREVPLHHVALISLGLAGATVGLLTGIRFLRSSKKPPQAKVSFIALLGVAGSISFFLLELPELGAIALMIGVLPSLACMFSVKTEQL